MVSGCLEYGIDITKDLLPVVPAAHYSCGGVWVDENGLSTVQRLYAIGEVAAIEGVCYGLVGPGYTRAEVVADRLLEGAAEFGEAAQPPDRARGCIALRHAPPAARSGRSA